MRHYIVLHGWIPVGSVRTDAFQQPHHLQTRHFANKNTAHPSQRYVNSTARNDIIQETITHCNYRFPGTPQRSEVSEEQCRIGVLSPVTWDMDD